FRLEFVPRFLRQIDNARQAIVPFQSVIVLVSIIPAEFCDEPSLIGVKIRDGDIRCRCRDSEKGETARSLRSSLLGTSVGGSKLCRAGLTVGIGFSDLNALAAMRGFKAPPIQATERTTQQPSFAWASTSSQIIEHRRRVSAGQPFALRHDDLLPRQ